MTADEMKLSMQRTYVDNRGFNTIPTHYIIGCNGDFVKVNELDQIVGATLNEEANINGIHIEIVGDFNKGQPNEEQYKMVNQLIEWILEKYPDMEIKGHGDFQAKNCPGVNFNWNKIKGNITSKYYEPKEEVKGTDISNKDKKLEITFSLSRYYTVVENQKRYYNGRTYEQDFKMNCAGSCNITANGHILTDDDMYKSVACPKEYPLGTKIYLEGIGEVICNDRGGAINGNRIDMWCGVGDKALDNWNNCPTGQRKGYIIQ